MSVRSRVCAAPNHPPRPHPGCSGCGCHCHPGRPIPPTFRAEFEAARQRARARNATPDVQEDDPDA